MMYPSEREKTVLKTTAAHDAQLTAPQGCRTSAGSDARISTGVPAVMVSVVNWSGDMMRRKGREKTVYAAQHSTEKRIRPSPASVARLRCRPVGLLTSKNKPTKLRTMPTHVRGETRSIRSATERPATKSGTMTKISDVLSAVVRARP